MTKKRTPRNKDVQGFEYIESESILHGLRDEYSLSREEHYILYSFYVEHSMYGDQSNRKRTFMDYGWDSNETTKNGAKEALCKVLQLYGNDDFGFEEDDELGTYLAATSLSHDAVHDLSKERGVFSISGEKRNESYFILVFSRIRNCLAHGDFALRYNSQEKMVIMENHYNGYIKARFILRLETILSLAQTVDKTGVLRINPNQAGE